MSNPIYLGAVIRIEADFTNVSTGELADPTTVTVTIQRPDGIDETVDATKIATGKYYTTYDTADKVPGVYWCRWDASGTLDAVREAFFEVLPSRVVGFDLQVPSWGDGTSVSATGTGLVIVGVDNSGLLHIRIFDATANRVVDRDETQIPGQAAAIAALKSQIPGLLSPHVLTAGEKSQVIDDACAIVGYTQVIK